MKLAEAGTVASSAVDTVDGAMDLAIPGASDLAVDGAFPRRQPSRVALISVHASPLSAPGDIHCGGQDVYVAHLACELARAGIAVDIFTRRDAPGQRQIVPWREKIRVIHVPAGPARRVPKEDLPPFVDTFARLVTRFSLRQAAGYDIAHASSFMSGMVAQRLKQELGLPFVITFHALGQVRRQVRGPDDACPAVQVRIEAALMREADRVIAACPQDRLDMEHSYEAPPSRIAIAPRGFSPEELWPVPMVDARRRLGVAQDRFVVLQLGRMAPRKGVDTVIQGVAMLRKRWNVDAELIVVGGDAGRTHSRDGPELARLRSVASDLGIADHVRFTGQQGRGELRDYYGAADVFASTPWYEPFGITPVEAMACARPVVRAEIGGIGSTVVNGITGYLVPPRDPEALAERLARLQRNPPLAQAMGEAGRLRACAFYTWQHVARQVADIYRAVLDESRVHAGAPLLFRKESA